MSSLKKQAIHGIKWTSLSSIIRTIIQLVQLVILARYLSTEDFGLIAIVMVVVGFSQLFMDMGISNAIIHEQKITDVQLSSLYWLNIISGLIVTITVFFIAPIIAMFYSESNLLPLIQLLAISFFINSIGNQYRVLLRKNMKFDILAKLEIIATISAFIVAVILAIKGYGAFSLVYSTLVSIIISNILLLVIGLKLHRPSLVYVHKDIKKFLTFGLYQMGQRSIVYFNNQFDVLLIGKLLGTETLGVYSLVKQLVMRPSQVINPIVTNVAFPIMSKVQHNTLHLKSIYLKIINYLSSINFFIYFIMIISADYIIPLTLGEKWINSIEIFQLLSIYALFRSTTNPAGSLLLAKGKANIGFYWSIGEFTIMPIFIFIGSSFGLVGISISLLIFQFLMLFLNWFFIVNKMLNTSFNEYFLTQLKPLSAISISVVLVYFILGYIELSNNIEIVIQLVLVFLLYFLLSYWINRNFILEIVNFFKRRI